MVKRNLTIETGFYNGIDSIGIVGPFDQLDDQIISITDNIFSNGKKEIVIDFSKTTYITSLGIAVLLKLLKKTQKKDGTVYITNLTQDMYNFITSASLDKYLRVI